MAGRKVFTSGEILTAADVNSYLMDQSVMVFADSTARSSAIPSPSEGMVTYVEDSNRVEVYDGSDFGPIGGILQVVTATKTDTFSASIAAGDNTSSGLGVTISLSNAGNKIIFLVSLGAIEGDNGAGAGFALYDGTSLFGLGDAASLRTQATTGYGVITGGTRRANEMIGATVVHSPGTTASTTYTVHLVNIDTSTNTVVLNRSSDDNDNLNRVRAASTLVAMEVAV